MGMYICGVLIGAMWSSVLAGMLAQSGWFHPLALAMGAGVGSASMMAAATAPIVAVYPEFEQQIMALAGGSKLVDYSIRRILWSIYFLTSNGKILQLLYWSYT